MFLKRFRLRLKTSSLRSKINKLLQEKIPTTNILTFWALKPLNEELGEYSLIIDGPDPWGRFQIKIYHKHVFICSIDLHKDYGASWNFEYVLNDEANHKTILSVYAMLYNHKQRLLENYSELKGLLDV